MKKALFVLGLAIVLSPVFVSAAEPCRERCAATTTPPVVATTTPATTTPAIVPVAVPSLVLGISGHRRCDTPTTPTCVEWVKGNSVEALMLKIIALLKQQIELIK